MPELIYDIKFKIHSPETQVNPKKLTQEIKELQGEFNNLDNSNKKLSKGLATSNQALFSFSDLVQDSAQFSQGFSQGMRAIGNNVGFTAELIGNLNRRVTEHNDALTDAEKAQGKSKSTIGELGRSFLGTGGIILGLNAVVLASQFAFEALDKKLKKLTDTGRAQADAFAEIAKAFADFDTGAPDPFGLRAREIEIKLLTEQLGEFESETKFFKESLDELPESILINTNAFRQFSKQFPIIGSNLVILERGLKNVFPKAFTKLSASSNKTAADLVILGENLSRTKENLDAATFAQDAFQKKLDESDSGLKGFVELTGELEKVLLQDALGIQLTASSLESLSEATQKQLDLVIQRGIETPEEIFTANQLISLQKQLKEAIDKTNESREKEIEQLEKSFESANERIRLTDQNIKLLEFELQASEEVDKKAKIQAETELKRQQIITEGREKAFDAKQEFINQGIDADKAAALASAEIELINEETKLKIQIVNAEERLKLDKLSKDQEKDKEAKHQKDIENIKSDAQAVLRAKEAQFRAQILAVKGEANEKDRRNEIAALRFNAKIQAISLDQTLTATERDAAIIVAASEFEIETLRNELDEKRRINDQELKDERDHQKRLAQARDKANAEFRAKQAEHKLSLLSLEKVFSGKLADIFINSNELEKKNEIAMNEFHDEINRLRSDGTLETAERDSMIREAVANLNIDLFNNERQAAEDGQENLAETMDLSMRALSAFRSLKSQEIDNEIRAAKARGASAKEIARLEKKKFEHTKKAQLGNAVINTAAGVAEALPNIPKSIAVGAIGALQIATILKTKFGGGSASEVSRPSTSASESGASGIISSRQSDRSVQFLPARGGEFSGAEITIINTFDDETASEVVERGNRKRQQQQVAVA